MIVAADAATKQMDNPATTEGQSFRFIAHDMDGK